MRVAFTDAEKARSLTFDVAILDVNLNGERTFPIAEVLRRAASASFLRPAMARAASGILPTTLSCKAFHQQSSARRRMALA